MPFHRQPCYTLSDLIEKVGFLKWVDPHPLPVKHWLGWANLKDPPREEASIWFSDITHPRDRLREEFLQGSGKCFEVISIHATIDVLSKNPATPLLASPYETSSTKWQSTVLVPIPIELAARLFSISVSSSKIKPLLELGRPPMNSFPACRVSCLKIANYSIWSIGSSCPNMLFEEVYDQLRRTLPSGSIKFWMLSVYLSTHPALLYDVQQSSSGLLTLSLQFSTSWMLQGSGENYWCSWYQTHGNQDTAHIHFSQVKRDCPFVTTSSGKRIRNLSIASQ